MEAPDEADIARKRKAIGEFCKHQNLRLVTVFCDRGSDGTKSVRPALAGLLDVLQTVHSAVLVVLDLDHLSPDEALRTALTRQVVRLGGQVTTIGETRPAPGETTVHVDEATLPCGGSGGGELVWNSDDTLRLRTADDDNESGTS
jgi:hypothetical protein